MLKAGTRLPVGMTDVFPQGCVLVAGSIAEAMEYDEKTGRSSPARDKLTGLPVWQCRVMDQDENLGTRSRETVVKILADRMPASPVGNRWEPVEFDGLRVTPYVTDKGRMAYSIRATAIKPARPQQGKDAA
jgi:hypothetical protein